LRLSHFEIKESQRGFNALNGRELRPVKSRGLRTCFSFNALNGRELRRALKRCSAGTRSFNALNGRELRQMWYAIHTDSRMVSMPSTGANCDVMPDYYIKRPLSFNALNGRELRLEQIAQDDNFRWFQCPQRARIATRNQ